MKMDKARFDPIHAKVFGPLARLWPLDDRLWVALDKNQEALFISVVF